MRFIQLPGDSPLFLRGSDFFRLPADQQAQSIRDDVRALLPVYDQLIRL